MRPRTRRHPGPEPDRHARATATTVTTSRPGRRSSTAGPEREAGERDSADLDPRRGDSAAVRSAPAETTTRTASGKTRRTSSGSTTSTARLETATDQCSKSRSGRDEAQERDDRPRRAAEHRRGGASMAGGRTSRSAIRPPSRAATATSAEVMSPSRSPIGMTPSQPSGRRTPPRRPRPSRHAVRTRSTTDGGPDGTDHPAPRASRSGMTAPPSPPSTRSTWTSSPAASPRSWARRAAASRRCSTSSAALDRPSQGEIVVDGVRVDRLSEAAAARFRRANVGFVFQFFHLLDDLTVADNVAVAGDARGRSRARLADESTSCSTSSGWRRRAGASRRRSAAASVSAWRSPGPSSTTVDAPRRRADGRTRPSQRRRRARARSRTSTGAARRSSSSPTTSSSPSERPPHRPPHRRPDRAKTADPAGGLMGAVVTKTLADLRRRRLQTAIMAIVLFLASGAATLALERPRGVAGAVRQGLRERERRSPRHRLRRIDRRRSRSAATTTANGRDGDRRTVAGRRLRPSPARAVWPSTRSWRCRDVQPDASIDR